MKDWDRTYNNLLILPENMKKKVFKFSPKPIKTEISNPNDSIWQKNQTETKKMKHLKKHKK